MLRLAKVTFTSHSLHRLVFGALFNKKPGRRVSPARWVSLAWKERDHSKGCFEHSQGEPI